MSKLSDNNTDVTIVIDSDDEDEVIFVKEDTSPHQGDKPSFLSHVETDVKNIFDNVVKLPACENPVVLGSVDSPESPGFEEDQIDLPSYNVQIMPKKPTESNMSGNPNSNQESPSKPIIKLAPLSKLMSLPNEASTQSEEGFKKPSYSQSPQQVKSRTVTNANVQDIPARVQPKRVRRSDPSKPKVQLSPLKKELATLTEKRSILLKFIPGVNPNGVNDWTWDAALKKTINFIMELRKSDCELDIAEEALMQTNIKLTLEYEKMLKKVYSLCTDADKDSLLIRKLSPVKKVEPPDESRNENQQVVENTKVGKKKETCEEFKVLQSLLGEVKESAKSHLLNFDPDVPYKEFLPQPLLNFDKPKSKSDILEEIMLLENAVSKCSTESEEITKANDKEMFKYEDLLVLFKKEFDLDITKPEMKEEIKNDTDESKNDENLDVSKNIDSLNLAGYEEPVKAVKKAPKKSTSPKKPVKKPPWNKGKRGYKKKSRLSNLNETVLVEEIEVCKAEENEEPVIEECKSDDKTKTLDENDVEKVDDIQLNDSAIEDEPLVKLTKKGSIKGKKVKKKTKEIVKVQPAPLRKQPRRSQKEIINVNLDESDSEVDRGHFKLGAADKDEGEEMRVEDQDNSKEKLKTPVEEKVEAVENLKTPVIKLVRQKNVSEVKVIHGADSREELNTIEKTFQEDNTSQFKEKEERKKPKINRPFRRKTELENLSEALVDFPSPNAGKRKRVQSTPKFAEGARTTRSFVKQAKEIMDVVDKEVDAILKKTKKISSGSESSSENEVEDMEESAVESDAKEVKDSPPKTRQKQNIKEPLVVEEKVHEQELLPEPEPQPEPESQDSVTVQESFADYSTADDTETSLTKVSPKKNKKKYYTGKQRRRKSTRKKNDNVFLKEKNSSVALEGLNAPAFDASPQSPAKQGNTDTNDNNGIGGISVISNSFSIDPSLFDNLGDDNLNDNSSDNRSPVKSPSNSPVKLFSSPVKSPVKSLFQAPDKNLSESLNDDVPLSSPTGDGGSEVLDFSVKPVKADSPLNLTKIESSNDVIDFSIKCKSTDTVSSVVDLSKPNINASNFVKTPFSSGKQIYTDPKEFNLDSCFPRPISPGILTVPSLDSDSPLPSISSPIPSVDSPIPFPQPSSLTPQSPCIDTSQSASLHSISSPVPSISSIHSSAGVSSPIPELTPSSALVVPGSPRSKDNIINEITDILVDLADVSTPQNRVDFEIDESPKLTQLQSEAMTVKTPSNLDPSAASFSDSVKIAPGGTPTKPVSPQIFSSTVDPQVDPFSTTPPLLPPPIFSPLLSGQSLNFPQGNLVPPNLLTPQFPNFSQINLAQYGNNPLLVANQLQALQLQQAYQALQLQQAQLSSLQRGEQSQQNSLVPYDPRGNKVDTAPEPNVSDPRIQRRLSSSLESTSDSDKMLSVYSSNSNVNFRDPRLAKKLIENSISDPPFSGNLQINQLISEVIKQNNFENFLMDSKTMNQNLEIDEEDLNLNRSDIDEFNSSDEADNDEEKQRQNLLRNSINRLIISDLSPGDSPVHSAAKHVHAVKMDEKKDGSSDESVDESKFTRSRLIRSPPMIKKKIEEKDDYEEKEKSPVKRLRKGVDSVASNSDADQRTTKRRSRKNVKYSQDNSDENSTSDDEIKESPPVKTKKKVSLTEYLGRKKKEKAGEKKRYSDDEDYSPVKKERKRKSKKIIDSDSDDTIVSQKLKDNDSAEDMYDDSQQYESDEKDKTELPEEIVQHLNRVSNIRHRKFEGKEKKIIQSKKDSGLRKMKFLDDLPDTDPISNAVVPAGKSTEKSLSKMDKHDMKSSRIVRKTITTERIVTKRVGGDSQLDSGKKSKYHPDEKVVVQERITLKVNKSSNMDRKKGINFKCGVLKEGEILKVVGGKLVRVRKKLSNSDEEIEKERSKLQKCLTSFKIKKKSDAKATVDDNPYSVLREDNLQSEKNDGPKYNDHEKSHSFSKVPNKRSSLDEKTGIDAFDKIKSPSMTRSNSLESSDNEVRQSPMSSKYPFNPVSRVREQTVKHSPNRFSPAVSSSPVVASTGYNYQDDPVLAIVRRPNLDIAKRDWNSASNMARSEPESTNPAFSTDLGRFIAHGIKNDPRRRSFDSTKKEPKWYPPQGKDVIDTVNQSDAHGCQEDTIFSRRSSMDVVKHPDVQLARKSDFEVAKGLDSAVARRSDYQVARTADMELSRQSNYAVTKGTNSESACRSDFRIAKTAGLEVAQKCEMEVSRCSDGESVRKSNIEERSADGIFSRRERVTTTTTIERRTVATRDFRRDSNERRQHFRTGKSESSHSKDRDERSILALMQSGKIKIGEIKNPPWRSRGDVDERWSSPLRNEPDNNDRLSLPWKNDSLDYDERDSYNKEGKCSDSDKYERQSSSFGNNDWKKDWKGKIRKLDDKGSDRSSPRSDRSNDKYSIRSRAPERNTKNHDDKQLHQHDERTLTRQNVGESSPALHDKRLPQPLEHSSPHSRGESVPNRRKGTSPVDRTSARRDDECLYSRDERFRKSKVGSSPQRDKLPVRQEDMKWDSGSPSQRVGRDSRSRTDNTYQSNEMGDTRSRENIEDNQVSDKQERKSDNREPKSPKNDRETSRRWDIMPVTKSEEMFDKPASSQSEKGADGWENDLSLKQNEKISKSTDSSESKDDVFNDIEGLKGTETDISKSSQNESSPKDVQSQIDESSTKTSQDSKVTSSQLGKDRVDKNSNQSTSKQDERPSTHKFEKRQFNRNERPPRSLISQGVKPYRGDRSHERPYRDERGSIRDDRSYRDERLPFRDERQSYRDGRPPYRNERGYEEESQYARLLHTLEERLTEFTDRRTYDDMLERRREGPPFNLDRPYRREDIPSPLLPTPNRFQEEHQPYRPRFPTRPLLDIRSHVPPIVNHQSYPRPRHPWR